MSRIVESLIEPYITSYELDEDMSSEVMFRDAAEFIEKWGDFIGDKDQFLDIMSNAWDETM